MQTSYKRFSVISGFFLFLVLLLANTAVMRRQISVQSDDQALVERTEQVLLQISQTESLLKDAETGQRGYLYTGNPSYLEPYELAISQIGPQVEKLNHLTSDTATQHARILQVRTLSGQKLDELGRTIALYKAGKLEAARALVMSNEGIQLMDDLRSLFADMGKEETELQASRTATYQHSVRVTLACLYLGALAAAVGLALLAFYILRQINLRETYTRQMQEREEWFRVTLTSLGDAVIATDADGRVTFLNPIAERLTGIPESEARGQSIINVLPIFNETTMNPVENPIKKVLETGLTIGLANHTVLKQRDGNYIPIEDSAAPIRDDRNRVMGVVLVFRDATFERQSQEHLRKSEKLAAAARLSATVAHEINNPLEAIGNLIYIAVAIPGVPPEAIEHLRMAEQEVERISHITRQTLGFYRESKQPERVELRSLVESVLRVHANKLKTKNIRLEQDLQDCPPVMGSPGELRQVLANLISNAADAVPVGGLIRVCIRCVEHSGEKMAEITVEDDGPGIPSEHHKKIFEPFFTTKKDVGTGLGLWVVKEIVSRHGGGIEVEPQPTSRPGTVFRVSLPPAEELDEPLATTA